MPIYEYFCKNCSKDFEIIQKFSDPPIKKCPDCGKKIEKKLSLSSFQLKGTGWYVTDFAKKDKKIGKEDQSESKPSSNEKKETKTESPSKAETKAKSSSKSKE